MKFLVHFAIVLAMIVGAASELSAQKGKEKAKAKSPDLQRDCKAAIDETGGQWPYASGARNSAERIWMNRARVLHGDLYMDIRNASMPRRAAEKGKWESSF